MTEQQQSAPEQNTPQEDSTEVSNKITDSKGVIAYLAEKFPACFSINGPAKPLKIGIFQDIVSRLEDDPRVSKTTLRSSLRHYTNSWRYLESIKTDAQRVDLDGQLGDTIEQEHADFAAQQLKESKEKAAEKRAKTPKKPQKQFKKPAFKSKVNEKVSAPNRTERDSVKRTPPPKLTENDLKVGTKVTVKLGKMPMQATISDIEKDGVNVQLDSGMTVKVKPEQLRLVVKRK